MKNEQCFTDYYSDRVALVFSNCTAGVQGASPGDHHPADHHRGHGGLGFAERSFVTGEDEDEPRNRHRDDRNRQDQGGQPRLNLLQDPGDRRAVLGGGGSGGEQRDDGGDDACQPAVQSGVRHASGECGDDDFHGE